MTSLVIEHVDAPATVRDERALSAAGDRAGDVLAGRTVWCVAAVPGSPRPALALRARLQGRPGIAARVLRVSSGDRLRGLAERIDGMLAGAAAGAVRLGAEDLEAERARSIDELIAAGVEAGDVVVAHDALGAMLAEAARERGAHVVWRLRRARRSPATARPALELAHGLTRGLDAYVLSWLERGPRGDVVERVAAALPSAALVAAKEVPTRLAAGEPGRLAWRMALAEVVRSDRGESVGGTLHPRPSIAAR